MQAPTRVKSQTHTRRREPPPHHRRAWCCSFTVPPHSPENPAPATKKTQPEPPTKSSFPNSPGIVTRIDPRRILSPGRVSPIDETLDALTKIPKSPPPAQAHVGIFDVRLNLKGKNGSGLVLELSSEVLGSNSVVFADLIGECRRNSRGLCRIEVADVENLGVFRETIELMFEDDIPPRLVRIGAYRTIDVLEASVGIKFTRAVLSCLKYLEAVPWTEEEEEKLRSLFDRIKFDHEVARDISARLNTVDLAESQQTLSKQLVLSVTSCVDANSRNELKSLVKGLLCKSSVYEKNYPDLNKADIFAICQSCINSLVILLVEATSTSPSIKKEDKPLIERISKQVDNIIWLLDILLDHQTAEDLVDMWTNQSELLEMHKCASPLVRYELSRVTAMLFIAMGTGKMHCRSEARSGLLQTWFRPMLLDFGWLQRCRKGLDVKALEEAMGQALLTLPLKEQYVLFMEWFKCFSKHGTECPNLSKAFQIWWRRSFLRGSETHAAESR